MSLLALWCYLALGVTVVGFSWLTIDAILNEK